MKTISSSKKKMKGRYCTLPSEFINTFITSTFHTHFLICFLTCRMKISTVHRGEGAGAFKWMNIVNVEKSNDL